MNYFSKVIIRQNGILIDHNNEPLEPTIKEYKRQIRHLKNEIDRNNKVTKKVTDLEDEIEALQDALNELYQEAKILIDLRGKLFVFLELPHPDTWNILKPILSHDRYKIEHPHVYQAKGKGLRIYRFLITSPNMVKKKYSEGIKLSAQRKGLPKLAQQSLIISDSEVELAKNEFYT